MPQGDKSSYSGKQKRKAAHIEKSYRKRGVSTKTAEARAWATVNKQEGGAKGKKKSSKSTSSRGRKSSARKSTATRKRTGSKTSTRRSRSTPRSRSTSRSRR